MKNKGPNETAHVQNDMNLHALRMLEGTSSLDHIMTIFL